MPKKQRFIHRQIPKLINKLIIKIINQPTGEQWPQRRIRSPHRPLLFLLSLLFGLLLAIALPALSLPPPESAFISQSSDSRSLLQQGIDRYEAEQFAEAIPLWQQALSQFAAAGDRPNQAFTLSNLSLAYQQLGQWQEADRAISQSLSLLDIADSSPTQRAILAKALNTQGRLYWAQGQTEQALTAWQQATVAYSQAEDPTGSIIALINQSRALQALGFSVQAESQLEAVYQLLQRQPDPALKAAGLRSLGNALRRVGKLEESRIILQESLAIAPPSSPTLLDLGNTERALAEKATAIGKTTVAQQHVEAARSFYQQAASAATSPLQRLQAQINQFSLLVSYQQLTEALPLAARLQPQLEQLPASRSAIYAQLNFAKTLAKLPLDPPAIAHLLTIALQQSRALQDPIAESYALGQLGELYEQLGQPADAQKLTQQALLKAEAVQAADVRYRWEWQLGRLLERQGDRSGALSAYRAAVESLKAVRNDLLLISSDVQFSFRDDVEPVYRGLVQLLLTTEAEPSQANLQQAIQQVDALQLTELENFLGCNIAQTVEINRVEVDTAAAKLYPVLLPDRLAVVLELPNQPLVYHQVLQPQPQIEATLQQLRENLREPDQTPEAIAQLQELYQWLIAPFQPLLAQQPQIETLVFVLDGELRNIPMAALFDGEQYLVNRYAVAVAPRLELFQPSRRSVRLKLFLGGVGEPQTFENISFPKIENLTPELDQIQQLVGANPPLLNAEFTEPNLEKQLSSGEFSAIHLKTHGIFSSDPDETFIVAYQELITSRDLGRLIQTGRVGEASPVELLVLSACSTARGDDRAVLGLAGTAIQAGARTAISTLWEAQDVPNTELMIQFYQELLNPQITRAQALRRAQLHLLELGYSTPHIWATYVLVGNWL